MWDSWCSWELHPAGTQAAKAEDATDTYSIRAEAQLPLRFGALRHLAGAQALRHKPHCRTPARVARQVGRARAPPDLYFVYESHFTLLGSWYSRELTAQGDRASLDLCFAYNFHSTLLGFWYSLELMAQGALLHLAGAQAVMAAENATDMYCT